MKDNEQEQVWQKWMSEHQALLFKVIRAYAVTAADQEDLLQEIALQLWRSVPHFRREAAVTTWLYRVALQTALTWSRKNRNHERNRQSLEALPRVLKAQEAPTDPRLDWLYREIGQLNEVDRSLCLLLLDGYSYREMATILGISASNVGVKIHRIKQHLNARSHKLTTNEI